MAGDTAFNYRQFIDQVVRNRAPDAPPPPAGSVLNVDNLLPFKATLTSNMTPEEARRIPAATYAPGQYGDMAQATLVLAAGVDALALTRPKNTRVLMIVYNPTAANLFFAFDQVASAGSLPIAPGGNLFFDNAVPQNDLHLFSVPGGAIPVLYMNVDLPNSSG